MTTLAVLAALLFPPDDDPAEHVSPRAIFWWPSLHGDLAVSRDCDPYCTSEGTELLFRDDLGLTDMAPSARLELGLTLDGDPDRDRPPDLNLIWWRNQREGTQRLSANELMDGTPFLEGDVVESSFDFHYYGFDVLARFTPARRDECAWGLTVGPRYVRAEVEVDSGRASESDEVTDFFVQFEIQGAWEPTSWFSLRCSVSAPVYIFAYAASRWTDGPILSEGALEATFDLGPLRVQAGYRYLFWESHADLDGEEIEIAYHGPSLAVSIRF